MWSPFAHVSIGKMTEHATLSHACNASTQHFIPHVLKLKFAFITPVFVKTTCLHVCYSAGRLKDPFEYTAFMLIVSFSMFIFLFFPLHFSPQIQITCHTFCSFTTVIFIFQNLFITRIKSTFQQHLVSV